MTNNRNHKILNILNAFVVYIVLILTSILILYPLVYVVGSAFSSASSLQGIGTNPFPEEPTFAQFRRLFTTTNYLTWYKNTLQIAAMVCLSTVVITSFAAYVFSRFNFAMRKQLMISFLVFQIFPSFIGMVAIYVLLLRLGGLDTKWGLALVYIAGNIPYNTWLVKGYIDNIPKSFDEAARIDGASHFQAFTKVILPISRPIITFLIITSFLGPWMDFIIPRMVLRSDKQFTLALGLFQLIDGKAANNYTVFAAGALLIAVPFVIMFLIGQKSLMAVLGSAGVKE
ncbi:MAG: sugar ABC transporter permease [Lachnospiraceae bacterium]|nr:sugar ABC transporter permease [Lachnospiraceae bacterium]